MQINFQKRLFILKFDGKSREAFHTHAFNAVSWILCGKMVEYFLDKKIPCRLLVPNVLPFKTYKDDFHMVSSIGTSWALSFRGPWEKQWLESTPQDGLYRLRTGRIKEEIK